MVRVRFIIIMIVRFIVFVQVCTILKNSRNLKLAKIHTREI